MCCHRPKIHIKWVHMSVSLGWTWLENHVILVILVPKAIFKQWLSATVEKLHLSSKQKERHCSESQCQERAALNDVWKNESARVGWKCDFFHNLLLDVIVWLFSLSNLCALQLPCLLLVPSFVPLLFLCFFFSFHVPAFPFSLLSSHIGGSRWMTLHKIIWRTAPACFLFANLIFSVPGIIGMTLLEVVFALGHINWFWLF